MAQSSRSSVLALFRKLLSVVSISFLVEHLCPFYFTSCNINKSRKLPFAKSSITSSSPLDVIFSDVWTSPISSSNDFHYYIIFVDHFIKYIWFYPLRRKSIVHSTFVAFKQLVEHYFTSTFKTLYTDNGSEFLALWSFLVTHGVTHLTTLLNIMGILNVCIYILSKWVSLSYIRPPFL